MAGVAVTWAFYDRLPDDTAVHWGIGGEPDGFVSKPIGPFILPLLSCAVLGAFLAARALSRTPPSTAYTAQLATQCFLFAIAVLPIAALFGASVLLAKPIIVFVGILLAFLGNLFGKTRRNGFLGIRTPWTLASDEVWLRTHRLGGWLLVMSGLALAVAGAMGRYIPFAFSLVLAAALVPVVYSYFTYRTLEKFGRANQ